MSEQSQHSHISRILTNPAVLKDPKRFFDVYERPVRKFFHCLCGNSVEADELCQEFALKFLSGAFANYRPDPTKGRFRDYLKVALRNQVKRSMNKGTIRVISLTNELGEFANNTLEPIEAALREFDALEGEQIKQLVDDDMRSDEEEGKNQYHSLLTFAINYQRRQLQNSADPKGIKAKVPVAAIVDFIKHHSGESVSHDTAKQRMFRAKTMFASKMIDEIAVRIGDHSHAAIRQAADTLGLSIFVNRELERRKSLKTSG